MSANSERIIELFSQAMANGSAEERAAFLAEACRDEPELREQVESLLRAEPAARDFLKPEPATLVLPTEKPGDRIGRYKLLQQIGEGGCGVVYMAEQEEPVRRRVALKVIKLGMDTREIIARFEAERQALALMDHPNIAKVLDAGATDTGRPYFVMELVRGVRITDFCDESTLTTHERLKLFVQVCQAIQHAHQKGIIHRDIKPSNILVTINDGVPVPKVIDFGIAKATQGRLTDQTLFTAFEQFIGTPAYMSPEQAVMTSLDIDTRSDIYSLGVLLYQLLTGQTPFDGKQLLAAGLDEMRRTIREKEPLRPSTRLAGLVGEVSTTTAKRRRVEMPKLIHLLRGDLDWIVMKCLEKDRGRRYETANGLARDIERHLSHEPVLARPPSNLYRFQKLARRNKLAFAAVGAVAAALVLGVVASTWQAIRATRAEHEQGRLRQQAEAVGEVAKRQEKLALGSAEQARRQQEIATEQELLARKNLYAADMNRVEQALDTIGPVAARGLLKPHTDETNLHGFEWRYLQGRSSGDFAHSFTVKDRIRKVVFSPDGKTLAAFEETDKIRFWDLASRTEFLCLTNTTGLAGFMTNAAEFVFGMGTLSSNSLSIYNLTQERVVSSTNAIGFPIALLADGRTAVMFRNRPRLVDARSGEELGRLDLPSGPGSTFQTLSPAFALSEDGRLVVSVENGSEQSNTGILIVRDLATRRILGEYIDASPQSPRMRVLDRQYVMRFLPDTSGVIWSGLDGVVRRWTWTVTGSRPDVVPGHQGPVWDIQFSRDGHFFATAGADRAIRLWTTAGLQPVRMLRGHEEQVYTVAISPDGRWLASGGGDRTVKLWDLGHDPTGGQAEGIGAREMANRLVFSPDGRILAVGIDGAKVGVIETSTGRQISVFPDLGLPVVFTPDSIKVVCLGGIADVRTAQCVWQGAWADNSSLGNASRAGQAGNTGAWGQDGSPDGRLVVASFGEGFVSRQVYLFDVQRQLVITNFEAAPGLFQFQFTKDSQTLLATSGGGSLQYWNVSTQGMSLQKKVDIGYFAFSSAISHDGSTVALGGDSKISFYDIHSGELQHQLFGHSHEVTGLAFSSDARTLASCSMDGSIKLWNLVLFQNVCTIPFNTEPAPGREIGVQEVEFAPDGNSLWALSRSGVIKFWRAPSMDDVRNPEQSRPAITSVWKIPTLRNEVPELETRGSWAGYKGQWAEAAEHFSKLLRLEPDNAKAYFSLALLFLETDQREAYAVHWQRVPAQLVASRDHHVASRLAFASLAASSHGVDLNQAYLWAERSITSGKNSSSLPWFHLAKALAEYRLGHWGEAVDWAQRVLAAPNDDELRYVEACMVLAMAKRQMNQDTDARAALRRGVDIAETRLPSLERGEIGLRWRHWIIAHLLVREAKTLIEREEGRAHN